MTISQLADQKPGIFKINNKSWYHMTLSWPGHVIYHTCDIMSHDVTSCHMSRHVCNITWYHVTLSWDMWVHLTISYVMLTIWRTMRHIRPKKKYLWFLTTLFFSADPIIFSTQLTVRPYFLRVVAGCCQNGVCFHTNYWKNHEKNIQKKMYFRPTDPNFFRNMKQEPQVFLF